MPSASYLNKPFQLRTGIECNRQTLRKPAPAHVSRHSRKSLDLYRRVAIEQGIIPKALFPTTRSAQEDSDDESGDSSDEYLSESSLSDASVESDGSLESSDSSSSGTRRRRLRGGKVNPRMVTGMVRLKQIALYKDALEKIECNDCHFRWFISVDKKPIHFVKSNLSAVALFTKYNPDEGMDFVEQLEDLVPEALRCEVCEFISLLFEGTSPTQSSDMDDEVLADMDYDDLLETSSEPLSEEFLTSLRHTEYSHPTGLQRQGARFFNDGATGAHRYNYSAESRRSAGGFQLGPTDGEGEFDSDSEFEFEDTWELEDGMRGLVIGDYDSF